MSAYKIGLLILFCVAHGNSLNSNELKIEAAQEVIGEIKKLTQQNREKLNESAVEFYELMQLKWAELKQDDPFDRVYRASITEEEFKKIFNSICSLYMEEIKQAFLSSAEVETAPVITKTEKSKQLQKKIATKIFAVLQDPNNQPEVYQEFCFVSKLGIFHGDMYQFYGLVKRPRMSKQRFQACLTESIRMNVGSMLDSEKLLKHAFKS